ncbi:MAG: EF-P 5-aminopentanol modification-associated protein YfmH [Anaerorhabdus sp.]
MKTIHNDQFGETYIEDYCDNGLHLVVWHKPNFASTSCLFATPFGSLDIQQRDENGNILIHPAGSAHFLEHKLFESEDQDIMSEFASLGASVNAFTSFQETVYYFNTTQPDFSAPLELLLDFVQNLNITEASVEKEKGIIIQELQMYADMPDSRLFSEVLQSLYHHHPFRIDIGGDEASVNATTKKDLENAYRYNYHPSMMHFIVVTPEDPKKVIELIKKNQEKKTFPAAINVCRHLDVEKSTVYQKEKTIAMTIQSPRVAVGVKLPLTPQLSPLELLKEQWCTRFILEAYFSSINPEYQTWLDQKKISYFFSYDENISDDASFLLFYDEGIAIKDFTTFLSDHWEKIKRHPITELQLNQLKKRTFGETLSTFDNQHKLAVQYFRSLRNQVSTFDLLNMIQEITLADCLKICGNLSFENTCYVTINPMD